MSEEVTKVQAALAEDSGPAVSNAVPGDFERVFRDHYPMVFRAAYRVTGNATDAEDVLQTVFLRLLRRQTDADPVDNLPAYLHRAAVNSALDVMRARQAARSVPIDNADPAFLRDSTPDPGRAHDSAEIRQWLRSAIAQLNPRGAEIFTLRYLEGIDNSEIARRLKTSQATIAVTLHRIRSKMQKDFRAYMEKRS